MSSTWITWLIIIGYMLFIFSKGVLKYRKISTTDDYLVAGRSAPWYLIFATLGATVIGGGASIGAVGKTYEWGLLFVLISSGTFLQFIFSGLVAAPQFRRWKLYTVAGYFGRRYNENARLAAFILSLVFSLFIIAAQMAAFGSVLSTLFPDIGDNTTLIRYAIIIGGIMVVVYSTAGGLLAVIYTDIYQFIILFGGFCLTLFFIVPDLVTNGGSIASVVPPEFFSAIGDKGWVFLITTFFAFLLGETFGPGYVTRFVIGRNVRHTRWGIAGVGFFLALTFPLIIYFIALYARIHFPGIEPQQALPMTLHYLHNPVLAGLIIAALLSAVMSSADSALNSATAIFVKDLFEHHLGWDEASEARTLRLARLLTAGLGISSTLIAVLWPDIIGLLLFTYHVWAPAIILPIAFGALSKEYSERLGKQIFWTMLIAVSSTMAYRATTLAETFDPAVFGVGVSVLVFTLLRVGGRLLYGPPALTRPDDS